MIDKLKHLFDDLDDDGTPVHSIMLDACSAKPVFDPEIFKDGKSLMLLQTNSAIAFPGVITNLRYEKDDEESVRLFEAALESNSYFVVAMTPSADDVKMFAHDQKCMRRGMLMKPLRKMKLVQEKLILMSCVGLVALTDVKVNYPESFDTCDCTFLEEVNRGKMTLRLRACKAELERVVKRFEKYPEYNPIPPELCISVRLNLTEKLLINSLSSYAKMDYEDRYDLFYTENILERGKILLAIFDKQLQYCELAKELHEQTSHEISISQRKHFLAVQRSFIDNELGEGSVSEIQRLSELARSLKMPVEVRNYVMKEIDKLHRSNEQSPEYAIQHTYLQTIVEKLPWGSRTKDSVNLKTARRILDRDHYGLEKVKERILEHLAVIKLRGDMKAPILCLYGPPGVGKTSLGVSIAEALGRKFVRVSLGGLHDESEIRGHRRTYIGSMPGQIVSGIIKAKSENPVFMLDEIDKVATEMKGDPSAALLEALDPEQNNAFHDNYLDIDYDLSKVLFIATANNLSTISAPLRDRMEIIDISGYILEEKIEIALHHLLPKKKKENGVEDVKFSIPRATMEAIIDRYTRESGVRGLDKCLGKIMRKVAWKTANEEPVPSRLTIDLLHEYLGAPGHNPDRYESNDYAGVVTGLAWTSVGGEILLVESALTKGKGEKLTLTGNLGDVMKESATLAMQYIRANADMLQIPETVFDHYNVHIHCPEGAIPKDGPSAGITMVTSLASAFTQRKVRAKIAMTGEITLRGRVTPIGGVKEKILAAKRAGITDIVLCVDNKKDIDEIKPAYLEGLTFHYVRDVREVLDFALLPEKVSNPKTFL